MPQVLLGTRQRWLSSSVLILCLFCIVACSSNSSAGPTSSNTPHTGTAPKSTVLPGQQIWKQGVSSFLFGTNDTQEWYDQNVETSTEIQQSLKNAHLTLMRTFFFDKSLADGHPTTDAEIEQRLVTIEKSSMTCLGVLQNIFDVEFDKHVVTYAGNRCQLYEFGNEPDYNGISVDSYLKQWNSVIPLLRQINPRAKFIGPVASTADYIQGFLTGVQTSHVLPDAISFHWYACYQNTEADCLSRADTASQETEGVRTLVKNILGKDLPIGITEWNFDPGNPPPAYGDNNNFITSFTNAALQSMIKSGVTFACQFDAASYAGYGHLDMFNVQNNMPKAQYYAIKSIIAQYRPSHSS
jgi:Glycosyl hydrolases family 39